MTESGVPVPPAPSAPTPTSAPPLPAASPVTWAISPPPAPLMARPPGPLGVAVRAFWGEHRRALPVGIAAACAVIGVAGGGLLVGHRLGLGAALVGLLIWGPAVPTLVRRRAVGDLVTAALAIALVAVVAVRDAGWVVGLCVATAAGAGAVAATSARSAPAVVLAAVGWAAGVVRGVRWVIHGAGTLTGSRRSQVLIALRSVGVTVVLLVVFGLLFSSADTIFASYIPRFDLDLLPGQVVVGALVAIAAATLAHLALSPPGWSGLGAPAGRPARLGEWLLPVAALDALVLAFVLVQVGALLGGNRHVLETANLTYAEYARAGFGQLVAVTALTLAVVAVAARRAPRSSERERLISRAALCTLCVGTLGVVASALRRMDLYIGAFGLTRLRLFVGVAELTLGVVLVLVVIAGVRWRAGWLPRAVVQVVAVAMLGLAAINPDAQIVRYNTTADLRAVMDVSYLQGLSADAVPAIDLLDGPLRACLLETADREPSGGPAAWNLGRSRAASVLATVPPPAPGRATCTAYAKLPAPSSGRPLG